MSLSTISPSEVAYLKMLHRMNERNETTSVSALAQKFRVKLPSAIEILSKLEKKGLVIRKPWKVPQLSKRGAILSEQVMHQHRVLENYLNAKLGMSLDTSCEEASKVDYLVGSDVIERMCKALNRPSRCLHGFPIQHGD
jgi:DtxR family transcriptional regulator, Mn-dependent transcriptional regulator